MLIGISRDIEFDIRNDLLDRLLVMEPEFYVRNRTGELMSRATNDLNAVRMVLGPGIMYSGTTIVTMVLAIALMLKLSPSLTLWVLLPVPVVAVCGVVFREGDSRALRKNSGGAGDVVRKSAGKPFGSARDSRIRAGRSGDARVR